jgi:hypothetical protein
VKSRLLLLAAVAAVMLAAPAAASAVDYCVGWTTPCPGTDMSSDLQAALTAAAGTTGTADRVLVDAAGGPYTRLDGFVYSQLSSTNHVDVMGVGATQPVIAATWDAGQKPVLEVASPGGSTVQNVHVALPGDATSDLYDGYGLQLEGGASASNVTVTGPNPGAGLDTGVILSSAGGIAHSTLDLSPTTTTGIDARPFNTDIDVTDNTITAARGINIFGDPAHNAVISRNLFSVGASGIYASAGGTWRAHNDLIDLRGTGLYGIYAGTSPSYLVNDGIARQLTIRMAAAPRLG